MVCDRETVTDGPPTCSLAQAGETWKVRLRLILRLRWRLRLKVRQGVAGWEHMNQDG